MKETTWIVDPHTGVLTVEGLSQADLKTLAADFCRQVDRQTALDRLMSARSAIYHSLMSQMNLYCESLALPYLSGQRDG